MDVNQRIREARELTGLKQPEFAKITGLAQSKISRYESGDIKNVPIASLSKIAVAVGKPISWFYEKEETAASPLAEMIDEIIRPPHSALTEKQVKALTDFFREFKKEPVAAKTCTPHVRLKRKLTARLKTNLSILYTTRTAARRHVRHFFQPTAAQKIRSPRGTRNTTAG